MSSAGRTTSDHDWGLPPLTREQQAVVDQPADVLLLVTGDAGAGKTHALARRVERLVAAESPDAGEILVLTFSRTAVRELRAQLTKYGDAADRVQAYAFDSWALDLLTRVDPDGGWPGRGSAARLDAALQHLTTGIVDELYDGLRHVVVDEAQDLAGRRGEMVEALLERVDCGFTIAGDPGQAVSGPGETRFFHWLRETFGDDLVEAGLTQNLRARTGEAAAALSRPARPRPAGEPGRYEELRATLRARADVGRLDQGSAVDGLTRYEGTTGVLCRTTGQALILSEELHRLGVPHRLRRSARERVVPSWVGRLLGGFQGVLLARPRFDELITALPVPRDLSPDRLWWILRRAASGRPGAVMLDLADLVAGISAGRLPDELTAQPPARFVVSAFHRAKGLEFDRVLVADPGPVPHGDCAKEARLLYLAMTRARYELFHLAGPDMDGLAVDARSGRWSRHSRGGRAWTGLQIVEGDVHTAEPAGVRDFLADAAEVQAYLAARVEPGDAITLERLYLQSVRPGQSPPYLLMHEGRPIGTASGQFREQLYRRLKLGDAHEPRHWPRTIDGVRADAVETVTGPASAGAHAGLGPYGIWLAPRLVGLGRFVWDRNDQ